MKNLHFITGVPKSGTSLITSVLKQNKDIHIEEKSFLNNIFANLALNWTENDSKKESVFNSLIEGYYKDTSKKVVFDRGNMWPQLIPLTNALFKEPVKILCVVRNLAQILSVLEKEYREKPFNLIFAGDQISTVEGRCQGHASSNGLVGNVLLGIHDAIMGGYDEQFLFVDYNNFCNEPKSQLQRITEFFNIPEAEYDLKNIDYKGKKVSLQPEYVNCVEYIGINLYEQYSKATFWDAWI